MDELLWEKNIRQISEARLLGRPDPLPDALRLHWSGSGMQLRLRCTALYVEIEAAYAEHAPWIAVLMDGALITRFALERGRRWYAALLGMDESAEHDISIVRDTQPVPEAPDMSVTLHALRVGGEVLPCPAPKMTVEFIGDSLTSGEGMIGPVGAMEWRMAFLSASSTYAQMVCNRLGAQGRWVSLCGWGVYTSWDGNRDHRLPLVYDGLCPPERGGDRPNDFSINPADLIVVNLGTNDSSVVRSAAPDDRPALRREIGRAAEAFLRQIRARQPGAYILWTYGMCGHPLGPTLRRAVETVRREGDARVGYLSLPACRAGEIGSREHPGFLAHRRAADAIVRRWEEIQAEEAK